jgi:hypothetical protein
MNSERMGYREGLTNLRRTEMGHESAPSMAQNGRPVDALPCKFLPDRGDQVGVGDSILVMQGAKERVCAGRVITLEPSERRSSTLVAHPAPNALPAAEIPNRLRTAFDARAGRLGTRTPRQVLSLSRGRLANARHPRDRYARAHERPPASRCRVRPSVRGDDGGQRRAW